MDQDLTKDQVHLIDYDKLVEGKLVGIHVNDVDLVVYLLKGKIHVYTNICPHEAGSLDTGDLEGDELVCPLHGWRFKSGKGPEGPESCLQSFDTQRRDGRVYVDRNQLADWRDEVNRREAPLDTIAIKDLPGPGPLPMIGNVHQVLGKQLHQVLEEWCSQYGLLYKIRIGTRTWVVIGDPKLQKVIIRERPVPWRRVAFLEPLFQEMGLHGVFDAEGEEWRRYRRLIMPAFNVKHLRAFQGKLVKMTQRLEAYWKQELADKEVLAVKDDLTRWAVDMTTNLVFDHDMNTLEGGYDMLQTDLDMMPPTLSMRVQMPFPYWRYFKLPGDRRMDKSMDRIKETLNAIISKARTRLEGDDNDGPQSLLDAMILARDEEGGPSLSDEELRGNMLTLLHAGEDTTSSTLAWMMHFLSQHPQVQEKVRAEVAEHLGESGMPSFEEAGKLVYLNAAIYEAMRLKSVTPVSFMENTRDVVISGLELPENTPVFLLMRWACMQEQYVPDPLSYKPERWLDEEQAAKIREVHNPFGGGPRYCPGRNLAIYEMKLAMCMICRRFRFFPLENAAPVEEVFKFTMGPGKLDLKLELI